MERRIAIRAIRTIGSRRTFKDNAMNYSGGDKSEDQEHRPCYSYTPPPHY